MILNSQQAVDRYFEGIRTKDVEGLVALYADDATFVLPSGKEFSGVAAIREMHRGVLASSTPMPSPVSMVVTDSSVAVENEVHLPDGTIRRTANFFYVNDDGRIRRISIYAR